MPNIYPCSIKVKDSAIICQSHMEHTKDLLAYWSSLSLSDLLAAVWIVAMVLFTLLSNHLFAGFIASKPAGRKTVIGGII